MMGDHDDFFDSEGVVAARAAELAALGAVECDTTAREPIVTAAVRHFDVRSQTVVVARADGREFRIANRVFPQLQAGDQVAVFDPDGPNPSLESPSWWCNAKGEENARSDGPLGNPAAVSFGDKVFFAIDSVDGEAVRGRVGSASAYMALADLAVGHAASESSREALVGSTRVTWVADPRTRPMRLTQRRPHDWQRHRAPLLWLPALAELERLGVTELPCCVESVHPDRIVVLAYGIKTAVWRGELGWYADALRDPPKRSWLRMRFHVDLGAGDLHLSLRAASDPEWSDAVQQFPAGTMVRATPLGECGAGVMLQVESRRALSVMAMAPFGQLSHGADNRHAPDDAVLEAEVLGTDPSRTRLLVSPRRRQSSPWVRCLPNEGDMIAAELLRDPSAPAIRWELGQAIPADGELTATSRFGWSAVRSINADRRTIELELPVTARPAVVKSVRGNIATVTFLSEPVADADVSVQGELSAGTVIGISIRTIAWRSSGATPVLQRLEQQTGAGVDGDANDLAVEVTRIEDLRADMVVEGTIMASRDKGLLVHIGLRTTAFLPGSHVDHQPPDNLPDWVGRRIQASVLTVDLERNHVIISRRRLLDQHRAKERSRILSSVNAGDVVLGRVRNFADFGAFVDLGGIDGLLHVTDMSWSRVEHPSELLRIGQELKVKVLSIDREREKIALGLKQLETSSWAAIALAFPIGCRVRGTVTYLTVHGAIVRLAANAGGLVHTSEMSWTHPVSHPSEVVQVGDEVDVVVLDINKETLEIRLGMKQAEINPWELVAEKYPVGTIVNGKVQSLANFGAFIELEPGIAGLLHVTDISWTRRIGHPSDCLTIGDLVQCVVTNFDPARHRIGLGLKQLSVDPWLEAIPARYRAGMCVAGTVTNLANFGAFVELEKGLEGLVHVSELSVQDGARPQDVLSIGERVNVKVLRVDAAERKIALSRRLAIEADLPIGPTAPAIIEAATQGVKHSIDRAPPRRIDPIGETQPGTGLDAMKPLTLWKLSSDLRLSVSSLRKLWSDCGIRSEFHFKTPLTAEEWSRLAPALPQSTFRGQRIVQRADATVWLKRGQGDAATPEASPNAEAIAPRTEWAFDAAAAWFSCPTGEATQACAELRSGRHAGLLGFVEWTARQLPIGGHDSGERAPSGSTASPTFEPRMLERLLNEACSPRATELDVANFASLLPWTWLRDHRSILEGWFLDRTQAPDAMRDSGLAIATARGLETQDQPFDAFRLIAAQIAIQPTPTLVAERTRLVKAAHIRLGRQRDFGEGILEDRSSPRREGGFAQVICVRAPSQTRALALKWLLLREESLAQFEVRERLWEQEAHILERIPPHRNLVGFVRRLGRFALVLEWLDGVTLADWLSTAPGEAARLDRARAVGEALLAAFEHLVEHGGRDFVHNDLSPRNIMLLRDSPPGDSAGVKLIDFGLGATSDSRLARQLFESAPVARHTDRHRAPELRRGIASPSQRTDIYSFGMVLHELIAGHPPTEHAPMSEPLPVGGPLGTLVGRLLAPDRPSSWNDVRRAWATVFPAPPTDPRG